MTEDGTTGGERSRPTLPARSVRPVAAGSPRAMLTAQDVRRLTLFKWRYSLESLGFTPHQAAQLLFLKWLHARRGPRDGVRGHPATRSTTTRSTAG